MLNRSILSITPGWIRNRATAECAPTPMPRAGWVRRVLGAVAATALASTALAGKPATAQSPVDDFGADVELAPFVVRGEQLAVSIHARSKKDRKYAEAFAEDVMQVVYESVTRQTGKGLVIVGTKGEPHPVEVFRKVQALAAEGRLDPAVAAEASGLFAFLEEWRASVDRENGGEVEAGNDEMGIDLEQILGALPLPLEGLGARLYQIAWMERFDDAKVTARFCALQPGDLASDLFAHFDWVFYLPHRGAFDRVLSQFITHELKKQEKGFFTRAAVRTVLVIAKPILRRAVEGMRKGIFFMTVVRAQTDYSDEQVGALMGAYMEVMMPGSEAGGKGSDHERAVAVIREAMQRLECADEPAETVVLAP